MYKELYCTTARRSDVAAEDGEPRFCFTSAQDFGLGYGSLKESPKILGDYYRHFNGI